MKKNISIAVLALLLSSEVSAVRIRDIFDAYDVESKKELLQTDDNIDPATLTAEIAGDQIAKDVKSATAGVADNAMVQLNDSPLQFDMESGTFSLASLQSKGPPVYEPRRILDKNQDGVEDNVHMEAHERDKFYIPNVYSPPVQDMNNTRHGRLPGHIRAGDFPPPDVQKDVYADNQIKKYNQQEDQKESKNDGGPTLAQSGEESEENEYYGPDFQPLEQIESNDPSNYDLVATKSSFRPAQEDLQVSDMGDFNIDDIPARSESEYDGEYVQLRLAEYVDRIGGPGDLALIVLKDNDLADSDKLPKDVEKSIREDHSLMPSSLETMMAGDEIEADDSVNKDLINMLANSKSLQNL